MVKYLSLFALLLTITFNYSALSAQDRKSISNYENRSIPYFESLGASPRVAVLMTKMTLQEKIGQLNLITPGGIVTGEIVSKDVESKIKAGLVGGIFGINGVEKVRQAQEMAVRESRLGIPLIVGSDVIHGYKTTFPIPLGLSCSWDMNLIRQTARIAAREATADGIMWTFSPMVDIARDPRWGRIAEGSGEDPFLGSKIAAAMVQGYQGANLADSTTMLSCVKHFALYGAAEGGRDYATVDMSHQRMMNEYLPPYKAAVDAGVGSVMTSFNVVDYVPASASHLLFKDILRDQWGFTGLVVTDYTAINEMIAHGLGDLQEVSQRALNVSVDMDMVGEGYLTTLEKSLEEKKISEKLIDQSCIRVLSAKEKLGLLDDPYRYFDPNRAKNEILSPGNRAFARKAAAESIVLLKNDKNILPLRKNSKITVIGPLADSRINMLGTWSVSGNYQDAVTVLEGIQQKMTRPALIKYAKGANISDDAAFAKKVNAFNPEIVIDNRSPDDMITEALKAARKADVIVAVMGEAADMTGEASSMTEISIQPSQKKLLRALHTLGKPIVMVLFNGRPMTLSEEMGTMDAILDVWFGGTEGGNAIADVLFGDINPSGKLSTSFPVNTGQIPVYHSMLNTGRPDPGTQSKFRSNYLDAPNAPLIPFGFGLSYTTFHYGAPALDRSSLTADGSITASIEITNTGKVAGEEIVQLYIRDVVASISRPMKELKGFEKIHLNPGETKTVHFTIGTELLKFYNEKLEYVAEPGDFQLMIGPNSAEVQMIPFKMI